MSSPAALPTTDARIARRVLIALALAAVGVLLWQLSDVFILVFGAAVLAAALRAISGPFERRFGLSTQLGTLLSVLLVLALLAGAVWAVGAPLADQFTNLRERLPQSWAAVQTWLQSHVLGRQLLDAVRRLGDTGVPSGVVTRMASATAGSVGTAAVMLIVAVYLAADPRLYHRGLVKLMPPAWRPDVDATLTAASEGLSRWLLGQAASMVFLGASTAVSLWLLGVPLALSLGLITGLLAFVPFFGAVSAGVLSVLIAFMEGPRTALYVVAVYLLLQQVEGNVLQPLVQRWAVSLPPVLGLMAAVIFGLMFGPLGVLFATPLMVVVMILVQRLYVGALLEGRHGDAAKSV